LSSQKEIKREEWDDKMRMSNQWRGLEADEIAFLRDAADEQKEKERSIKKQEMEELMAFKSVNMGLMISTLSLVMLIGSIVHTG
jgi:hypothetical protein